MLAMATENAPPPYNSCSPKFCKILKIITAICCFSAFMTTSSWTISHYIDGKTIVSSDFRKSKDGELLVPSILICAATSFKETKMSVNISEYLENTLKLSEFLQFAVFYRGSGHKVVPIHNQFHPIYTAFNGNCFLLNLQQKVK